MLFLSQNGYETKGCLSANEAYNAMYNNPFDIIISDIMMSEIDGFEFAETVRNATPRAVDVYITKLREKVKDCKDFEIVTVHSLEYKAVVK